MQIGIISDTHNWLDPEVKKFFKNCDEIWHAGDIGDFEILEELSEICAVRAVYGNIDGGKVRISCPEFSVFKIHEKKILMIHIAGKSPRYNTKTLSLIKKYRPNVLICGHSHILKVNFDKTNRLLYVNPGAAGRYGFHHVRTVLTFEINEETILDMKAIELGSRSKST